MILPASKEIMCGSTQEVTPSTVFVISKLLFLGKAAQGTVSGRKWMTKSSQDTSNCPEPLSSFCYDKPSALTAESEKHGFAMVKVRSSPTLHKGLT